MKKIFFITLISFVLLFSFEAYGQTRDISFGLNIGGGVLSGNIPSQGSFFISLSGEIRPILTQEFSLRGNIFYIQKIEILLPEDRTNRYYPFVNGISLQLILRQELNEFIFFEEGLGPLYMQNRTFSDSKDNNAGVVFTFGAGLKISNHFNLLAAGEIAETFGNNAVRYVVFYLQGRVVL